jgi:hypothetical protein
METNNEFEKIFYEMFNELPGKGRGSYEST